MNCQPNKALVLQTACLHKINKMGCWHLQILVPPTKEKQYHRVTRVIATAKSHPTNFLPHPLPSLPLLSHSNHVKNVMLGILITTIPRDTHKRMSQQMPQQLNTSVLSSSCPLFPLSFLDVVKYLLITYLVQTRKPYFFVFSFQMYIFEWDIHDALHYFQCFALLPQGKRNRKRAHERK